MKKPLIVSMLIIAIISVFVTGGTMAQFYDMGTSDGNKFTAATLDVTVDGKDDNVVKFNVSSIKPGSQPRGSYTINNVGSIGGFLNITDVKVTNLENDLTPPEVAAGDNTDVGELGSVVDIVLFIDRDGSGWISEGDGTFYNGKVNNMPSSFIINESIPAGGSTKIVAILNWFDTANDNLAQSDSMIIDLTFKLSQKAM
jgi:predicted ribosomally synthesized peptide with SipW-like signal peptide